MQRIKKAVVAGLAILVLGLGATTAQAVSLSLDETDFWSLYTPPGGTDCTVDSCNTDVDESFFTLVDVTKFTTIFADDVAPAPTGNQTATVGGDFTADFSLETTFELRVTNVNKTTWSFQIGIVNDDGATNLGNLVVLDADESAVLTITLGDLDNSGDIEGIFLNVSCNLPCGGAGSTDRTAEYEVSPVPIPPSLAMFGSALIGLVAFGFTRVRRRRPT